MREGDRGGQPPKLPLQTIYGEFIGKQFPTPPAGQRGHYKGLSFYFPPFLKGGLRGDYSGVLPYNKGLKEFARELRQNQTEAETFLWLRLRKKQLKNCQFYRQRIIGNYIVDFYCPEAKLVIEIDGGQHYSKDGLAKDKMRDGHLSNLGLTVLRFSAREVFENTAGVLEQIFRQLP